MQSRTAKEVFFLLSVKSSVTAVNCSPTTRRRLQTYAKLGGGGTSASVRLLDFKFLDAYSLLLLTDENNMKNRIHLTLYSFCFLNDKQ